VLLEGQGCEDSFIYNTCISNGEDVDGDGCLESFDLEVDADTPRNDQYCDVKAYIEASTGESWWTTCWEIYDGAISDNAFIHFDASEFATTTECEEVTLTTYLYTCDGVNTGSSDATSVNVESAEIHWTFMVYLDGDNNLESCAIDDFLEMSSVSSTAGVNIVVQFDRIPSYSSAYDDWTTCKRFLVTPGMTPTPANALTDLGECNMGDPNTLSDFVDWAMTQYPADNYALILWDHGSGWKEKKWVPWDNGQDYLTLQETEQALAGKSLSLLGYDACLMHLIEVVYQVAGSAGISVGSEESEPGDGWPYNTILSDLTGTPTMTPTTLGTTIVQRYIESYGTGGDETQSAVDNGDVSGLVTAVDNLADVLITKIPDYYDEIKQARDEAEEFYWDAYIFPQQYLYIDLYHFAELIESYVPGTSTAAQAVMNNINTAVYAEDHGSGHPDVHGLSIYFPETEAGYLTSYENTNFAVDTHWDEFLKEYYAPTICGNMNVNPTSWSPPPINCGESDSQIVTVSATGGTVEGVTVSKISGETWLTLSQTNLGDIASGSSETFTMTASPPAGTSRDDYPYTVRVSNTCGTPSTRDVSGTITVTITDTTPPTWGTMIGIQSATDTGNGGEVTVTYGTATDADSPPVKYNAYYSTSSPATGGTKVSNVGSSPYTVTGLTNGQLYYFSVRAEDSATPPNEDTNTFELTATPTAPLDPTPPSAVTDLATTDPTSNSIKLIWTAPGDDGNTGTATTYDIRYLNETPIAESNWASAIQCTISNSPSGKTKGAAITATREISPQQVMNGSTFAVTVTIIANQDIYAPILDEDPPTGWSVTPVQNDGATFKESEIKWLWTESLSKGDSRTVIYNVTVPSDTEPKDYTITGNVSAYGIEPITVGGDNTITVITDWNPWDDDGIITDSEIQEAVYCWLTDTPKNDHLIMDSEIQEGHTKERPSDNGQ
jgi:hypothetical protein